MEEVQVVGMRPVWGLASPSPFGLKLETWLRMEHIPYRRSVLTRLPRSRTGKIPYLLRADGSTLADSSLIIETLARERGIDLSYGLPPQEQALGHAVIRLLEESTYFVAVWERWSHPQFWPISRRAYFGSRPSLPLRLIAALVRRKVKAQLHGQGTGRHEPDRIEALGAADVRALAQLLGERPFFGGERPALADATAYGFLAVLLAYPGATPLQRAVQAQPSLLAYCERMRDRYWSDAGTEPTADAPALASA